MGTSLKSPTPIVQQNWPTETLILEKLKIVIAKLAANPQNEELPQIFTAHRISRIHIPGFPSSRLRE